MRRSILYNFAHQQSFNKIALGHHRDDLAETLFLNLFYGGKIKSMSPKLKSDDGRNAEATLLSLLETPLAPLWAWLLVSELPTDQTYLGGGLILLSVVSSQIYIWKMESSQYRPFEVKN